MNKNRSHYRHLLALVATALYVMLTSGCGHPTDSASFMPTVDVENSGTKTAVAQFLNNVMAAKYNAMRTGDGQRYSSFFAPGIWPTSNDQLFDDDPQRIVNAERILSAQGIKIESIDGQVEIGAISDNATTLDVNFKETFELFQTGGSVLQPGPSRGLNLRHATLQRTDEGFMITSYSTLEQLSKSSPNAVVPLSAQGERGPVPRQRVITPTMADIVIFNSGDELKPNVGSLRQQLYVATNLVSYADRWAMDHNMQYRSFEPDDCTNFASQALVAGGRQMGWGFYTFTWNWWYNAAEQTWTWNKADSLFNNFVSYTASTSISRVADIQPGDFIFADWDADGKINHTMIVVSRPCPLNSWACVLVDYHSNPRWHYSMSNVVASSPSGAKYYAMRPVF